MLVENLHNQAFGPFYWLKALPRVLKNLFLYLTRLHLPADKHLTFNPSAYFCIRK